jgi:hypothetical protein
MLRPLAAAAALTLSLSACGAANSDQNSKFKGAQQDVVKVVDSLAQAGKRGDAKRICTEILAKQLVTELKTAGGDCVTEMDRAIKDASDYDLQVTGVKVNGSTATAQVRQGDKGQVATFTFVKEGGAWKASALGS